MKLKPGVQLLGLRPETLIGVMAANQIYGELGYNLTLTSVTEGKHSRGSRHYIGCAFDCRIRMLKDGEASTIANRLRSALGSQFDVVLEETHIHVEFDPEYHEN